VDLYIHSPIRLRSVLLNYLSTGTTLPYPVKGRLLGVSQTRPGRSEEKNICPFRELNPDFTVVQPEAYSL
jgi:hypothetical protein